MQTGADRSAGICEPPPSLFCNPGIPAGTPGNVCPPHSYCVSWGTPAQLAANQVCAQRPRLNLPADMLHGVCRRAEGEGERCDSEWTQAIQPLTAGERGDCLSCAPGLVCWNTVCRRPCRPEDGGLGNCPTDQQTAALTTQWTCSAQTGRRFQPPEQTATAQLCSVCVPDRAGCDVPPDLLQQSPNVLDACCDPNDVCARPLDLTNPQQQGQATCCKPPTRGDTNGGRCSQDQDCCSITTNIAGQQVHLERCCTSPDQQGCRPSNIGRCAGCGPGTHVPCCNRDGAGCSASQTCIGSDDTAHCLACGNEGLSCCQRGDQHTCSAGLTCFQRPGQTPSGDRCERCGDDGQQCCPGGGCGDGQQCIGGVCHFCGEANEPCCNGRRCDESFLQCQGPDRGTCVQTCGATGLQCCGSRGGIFGPPRGFCLDRSDCDEHAFVCNHCGRGGEECCDELPVCDAGLGCDSTSARCATCGGRGQPCCYVGDQPMCAMGFACRSGACTPCGSAGQPCCGVGPACASGTSCSSGICTPPPG